MKTVWWIVGILLLVAGVVGIAFLLGEVFSRAEGFTSLGGQVWGYIVFHLVTMSLGLFCVGQAARARKVAGSRSVLAESVRSTG